MRSEKCFRGNAAASSGERLACRRTAAAEAGTPHRCELEDGPAVALDTARRLACDASVVGIVEGKDGDPHEDGCRARRTDDGLFVFTRPNGTRVEPNGARRFSGNVANLPTHLRALETELAITADAAKCEWRRDHGLQPGDRSDAVLRAQGQPYIHRALPVPALGLPKSAAH
jgi:hypothetical protein